jgi:hypothetical protein
MVKSSIEQIKINNMNLQRKIKYWMIPVLFFTSIPIHSQTLLPPSLFNEVLTIATGHHYPDTTGYPALANDDYWRILKSEGKNLIIPKVGRINNNWYDPQPPSPLINWIYAENQEPGTYYYRYNFCVYGPTPVGEGDFPYKIIALGISADNTIKRVRLDGNIIVDYADSAACSGQTRDSDFLCLKRYLDIDTLPQNGIINKLPFGSHLLEFEVQSKSTTTGILVGGALVGFYGYVTPYGIDTNYYSNDFPCAPKGQIRGIVFNDLNLNNSRDAGEPNVSGISVSLKDSSGAVIKTVQTDADGAYNFYNLNVTNTYSVSCTVSSPFDMQTFPLDPLQYRVSFSLIQAPYDVYSANNIIANKDFGLGTIQPTCDGCIPSFLPLPGKKYVLSAWVKEEYNEQYPDTYSNSGIKISFNGGQTQIPIMRPSGPVIDRWQRIEAAFTTPFNSVTDMDIELVNDDAAGDVFFDDIRIHPFKSNMKSFVYNPATQKVEAILDENNFSTRFEYDDEGILVRVKKETERGVQTIKETRNNQSKIKAQ